MVEVHGIRVPHRIDDELFGRLLLQVGREKQTRILEYSNTEDRIRSLFSDLLVRAVAMRKTGRKNSEIVFAANEYGKPYLKGNPDFHFNVSHSGIWVVAAVDTRPVGIDVEEIKPVDMSLSADFLSEDEHRALMNAPDKLNHFYTLWTMKESYLKILGRGLNISLNSFTVDFETDAQAVLTCAQGGRIEGVNFARYDIHRDYKLVLCATHNLFPPRVNILNANLLLRKFVA